MSQQKNDPDVRFWLSRKFWMAVISAVVFTVIALSRTVVFSSGEVMTFVLGLAGISIGGHVVSDIASMFSSVLEEKHKSKAGSVVMSTAEPMAIPAESTVVPAVPTTADPTVETQVGQPPGVQFSRGRG